MIIVITFIIMIIYIYIHIYGNRWTYMEITMLLMCYWCVKLQMCYEHLASGKRLHSYGQIHNHAVNRKIQEISMAIFNSKLEVYQRVWKMISHDPWTIHGLFLSIHNTWRYLCESWNDKVVLLTRTASCRSCTHHDSPCQTRLQAWSVTLTMQTVDGHAIPDQLVTLRNSW